MKTVNLILVVLLVSASQLMNAQDRYLKIEEYPTQITSYAKEHFPKSDIVSIKEEKDIRKIEYEVKLRNLEELEFDQDYKIKSIESKTELPHSVVPQKILDYVARNHPNQVILEWKRKRNNKQEIELDNDLEIQFDLKGNFIKADD